MIKLHMSYGKEDLQMLNTSRYLGVSATLSGRIDLVSLNLELMMAYSLGIQVTVKHTIALTSDSIEW